MKLTYSKELTTTSATSVENIFIYEYLPDATGDAVKVYLYGLFLCQTNNSDIDIEEFANNVKLDVNTVKDIFTYWEEFGLVSIDYTEPYTVIFYPVRNNANRIKRIKNEKYGQFTASLQAIITSRMISTTEYSEYFTVMEEYNIKPEAMIMIVKYCLDLKGDDINYRYISKVAKDFGIRGINTKDKVDNELHSYNTRSNEISAILLAMNSKRKPEMTDMNMLNKWTGELGFEYESILYAAQILKKSSMEKLDEFVMELYTAKCFDVSEIKAYSVNKKRVRDITVKINKALSYYCEVLDTEIDNYVSRWLSYGFEEGTLIYIANRCFRKGLNTLENMDNEVEKLYKNGTIDIESVTAFIVQENKQEDFIKELLSQAGLTRKPNNWDRQNLIQWKSWNFSDEMILEAAKLSGGKSNPIAYMNAILSGWKNNDIFTTNEISGNLKAVTINESIEKKISDILAQRREKAVHVAEKNLSTALKNQKFSDIYYRLNSMERDFAIAEMHNDNEQLEKLNKEQKQLISDKNIILSEMNLTVKDLSPKYHCPKCKDTGKNGKERCSCYYELLSELTD